MQNKKLEIAGLVALDSKDLLATNGGHGGGTGSSGGAQHTPSHLERGRRPYLRPARGAY